MSKLKPTPKFKQGDLVTWTSQANGNSRTKIGVVVQVIQPEVPLAWLPQADHWKIKTRKDGSRKHESYIVCIPHPTNQGGPEFFWPATHGLKAATHYMPAVLNKNMSLKPTVKKAKPVAAVPVPVAEVKPVKHPTYRTNSGESVWDVALKLYGDSSKGSDIMKLNKPLGDMNKRRTLKLPIGLKRIDAKAKK